MGLIYLVLDGAADRLEDEVTSYSRAKKPFLDLITRSGRCGLMYTVSKGIAPESDGAVLSILGYNPHLYYTGRGPLEALGAGIKIREGWEVAFRANFATVNPLTLELIDRRAGRSLTTEEAKALAKALDGMDLGIYGGYVRVAATVGHRGVVVVGSKEVRLSDEVDNTDPAYRRVGKLSVAAENYVPRVKDCVPLTNTEEAKTTCELVNKFMRKAGKILDRHPINIEREKKGLPKANAILLRDAGGSLPKVRPIRETFNLRFGAVVEMPVELGIARLLDMDVAEVGPPTKDKEKDYAVRLNAAVDLLNRNDVVYVHLKGPDEPGHDGDVESKVRAIEAIDRYFVEPLIRRIDLNQHYLLVTSDHATPPSVGVHTDDPVPVVITGGSLTPDSTLKLTERDCAKGSLGVISHGWNLLPKVFSLIK